MEICVLINFKDSVCLNIENSRFLDIFGKKSMLRINDMVFVNIILYFVYWFYYMFVLIYKICEKLNWLMMI